MKIKQLMDMATQARSSKVREAYEAQIEELLIESETSPELNQEIDRTVPYRTAFDKATALLKNPHDIWEKLPVIEKHRLYYFIFDKRIGYDKENGYRTADVTSFSSLFQDFS